MTFDPIANDPPHDPNFPATSTGIEFESHGATLHGMMYIASGAGRHPLILLLHGIPGHERNFDLAHILWRAGYNVVVFHYRGSWGSGGMYRLAHVLEDVQSAIRYFKQPSIAEQYRIDTGRIVLIGHSLGGWAALNGLMRGDVNIAVATASANVGLMGAMINEEPDIMRPMTMQLFEGLVSPLQGATAKDLVMEMETHADEWDYTQHVKAFAGQKLFLIGASDDDVVPVGMYHLPFVATLERANTCDLTHTILESDHGFSSKRVALAREILAWLQANV